MKPLHIIEGEKGPFPRIRLTAFGDLQLNTSVRSLIRNLIPYPGLAVVWGPPKCGKSFWAFDALMHVALGWDYRDNRVQQGPVVYCAFEGQSGFPARAEAFRQRFLSEQPENPPFYLVTIPLDLVRDHAELVEAISAQIGDTKPVAVALDTLNRSLRGSESSDEDMAAYVTAADAVKLAFQCSVVVIHHCGHDGTRPRGHSSLIGAADAQIKVSRDAADNIVAEVEFAKDGPSGYVVTSRLEVVDVGKDDDGETITSCVVVESEVQRTPKQEKANKGLTKTARTALRVLTDVLGECGTEPPPSNHIPPRVRVTTVETWRRYCYQRGISTGEDRAKQKAFKSAAELLVANGQVAIWGDHVWIS